ncbi:MAG TPA: HNH endonuclease [Hyphomonadaceae bacterium]|jgi:5-methylcytosine-specific restriction protein A|nr:HNH endonuclease [Hyphomonadaceae bacterium]
MKIRDLPRPVTAAKSDSTPNGEWIGFTPIGRGPGAPKQCESAIRGQMGDGYVLEYVSLTEVKPNPGFEKDPDFLSMKQRHKDEAGSLLAVARLGRGMPLAELIGPREFQHVQQKWANGTGVNDRWAMAFPILERYAIVDMPDAKTLLGKPLYKKTFATKNGYLRILGDDVRARIADLEIEPITLRKPWAHIRAERTPLRNMREDYYGAIEGLSEEQVRKLLKRARRIAERFVNLRENEGTLLCEHCGFDPAVVFASEAVSPRSLLDAHHKTPLEQGRRNTTVNDFALLCPTCHRIEHRRLKTGATPRRQHHPNNLAGPTSVGPAVMSVSED